MSGSTLAVVELGSGSAKLLVADADGAVEDRSTKTRLAVGLADTGLLNPDGLTATREALASFRQAVDHHQVEQVAVVATAAARTASDLDRLRQIVTETMGVDLDVLDPDREARLALDGVVGGGPWPPAVADRSGPLVVVDVGAASAEFALAASDRSSVGPDGEADVATFSMPIGGRTVVDSYLHGDPPRPEELSGALSVVELHLDDMRRELPDTTTAIETGRVIGVGAVIEVAAVEIGTDDRRQLDGYRMPKDGVEEVFRTLASESSADRIHNPGLNPDHVDDIVGGLVILVEFMRQFGVDELTTVIRGVRHGVVLGMAANQ